MQLPSAFLTSIQHSKGFDQEAFEAVHASGEQITSIRINPSKYTGLIEQDSRLARPEKPVPWSRYGYYLSQRPSFTFDPLFHAGCYYVQEASSMFIEQALQQTTDLSQPLRVLDLCAAPGGKSTHLQSLLSKESLLVSNEVIRTRAHILKDNIVKWGCSNTMITNNDPSHFSKLEGYFDVILVDAPCSGSGLFRRDQEAIGEWSENNVQLCAQRQQRILADCWPCLKEGGVILYSTCSYSEQEDEEIVGWIENTFGATICSISLQEQWGVVPSGGGYRFWPHHVQGEGFFIACFRKNDGVSVANIRAKNQPEIATKQERTIIAEWVKPEGFQFIRHASTIYAWQEELVAEQNWLLHQLRVVYSGTIVGEMMRDKLVPDHALAMTNKVADKVPFQQLDYDQAIQYLQRKELSLQTTQKGWQVFAFQGHSLGWANVLATRINNYYPKELRILKDR